MKSYARLSDPDLVRCFAALVAQDRTTTAELLAVMAEVDDRKLYLPAGYPSLLAWCVGEFRMSEDVAFHRIRAARTARQFPALLAALTDGRLHLTAVLLLTPWLTHDNVEGLLAEATHKTKREIEALLARRFPRSGVFSWVEEPVSEQAAPACQLVPERVGTESRPEAEPAEASAVAVHHENRSRVKPLSAGWYEMQLMMCRRAHDKLRHVSDLLSHEIPSGNVAEVFERTLDLAIGVLEKRKFAATSHPRRGQRRPTASPRHIPADVQRAVWERDGGQCTFVSESGQRCPATRRLEFDHILEVARGGEATVDGIRLLCRAHNQYQAERTFGAEFMRCKREAARERSQEKRPRSSAAKDPAPERRDDPDRDVAPWLRALGIRGDDLRRAVAASETIADAPLEKRVRLALSSLARSRPQRPAVT
jgi:5-methylcytosine-specific restriction endonuclease McrA